MPGDSPPRCMPGDQAADIPRGPGSYVLVLWMAKPCPLAIGSLGRVTLPGGFLLYTGSARGGLRGFSTICSALLTCTGTSTIMQAAEIWNLVR